MDDQADKDREKSATSNDPDKPPAVPLTTAGNPPPPPLARQDFRPRIDFDFTALEAEERLRQAEKDKPIPLTYSTPAEEAKQKRDAMEQKVAKFEEKILTPLSPMILSITVAAFLVRLGFTRYETRLLLDWAISLIVIGIFIAGWVINYRSYKK
jgi:hypothetical protein